MQRLYVQAWLPQDGSALALNVLKFKDICGLSCINKQKNLCFVLKIEPVEKVSSLIKLKIVVELEYFFLQYSLPLDNCFRLS